MNICINITRRVKLNALAAISRVPFKNIFLRLLQIENKKSRQRDNFQFDSKNTFSSSLSRKKSSSFVFFFFFFFRDSPRFPNTPRFPRV